MINIRLTVFVFLVFVSLYLIFSPYLSQKSGVIVYSLEAGNKCTRVKEGSVIVQADGLQIKDSADFSAKTSSISTGSYVPMIVDGGPGGCTAISDGYLGMKVVDFPHQQIKFSTDLAGGVATKIKLVDTSKNSAIVNLVKLRLGLTKAEGYAGSVIDGLIEIKGLDGNIEKLLKPCKFTINVEQKLDGNDTTTSFIFDGNKSVVEFSGTKFSVNGNEYELGDAFYLKTVEHRLEKFANETLVSAVFVNNSDVQTIGIESVDYVPEAASYRLQVPIVLTPAAAEKFKMITNGIK